MNVFCYIYNSLATQLCLEEEDYLDEGDSTIHINKAEI